MANTPNTEEPASSQKPDLIIGGRSSGSGSKSLLSRWGLGLVILLAVICLGGYLYYRHHQSTKIVYNANHVRTVPYTYSTSSLSAYSLPGSASGQGMSFKLPSQFSKELLKTEPNIQAAFTQGGPNPKQPLTIAQAAAETSAYPKNMGPPSGYLTTLNTNLKNPASNQYKQQLAIATELIKARYPKPLPTVNSLKAFTNANITGDAWIAGYTTASKSSTTGKPIPVYQGEIAYVTNQQVSYYLLVNTLQDNWQSNQAVWTQVFDSLKVGE